MCFRQVFIISLVLAKICVQLKKEVAIQLLKKIFFHLKIILILFYHCLCSPGGAPTTDKRCSPPPLPTHCAPPPPDALFPRATRFPAHMVRTFGLHDCLVFSELKNTNIHLKLKKMLVI